MKRQAGFWVLWGVALVSVSGCAMTERQKTYTAAGALAGAAAGALIGMIPDTIDDDSGDDLGKGEPPPPPPAPAPRPVAPPPPPPPPPAEAKRIILRGINFDFDKANIKAEFAPVLDEAAQILKDNPNVNVVVEGHTDSIGSDAYNQRLSERRARAVKQYLTSRGVEASRLETVGKGETEPVADNTKNGRDNPEGRAMNRRAELKVQ